MGDEVLEGYAAHLQIVFDHYASNEVLDEQGFHAFLRDCHVSPILFFVLFLRSKRRNRRRRNRRRRNSDSPLRL